MQRFDDLAASIAADTDIIAPDTWAQGRTVYGGPSGGLLCAALSCDVEAERRLRYLKVGFLRPLEVEVPFKVIVTELAAGRTVIVRTAEIVQDGKPRVTAQANFVSPLESSVQVEPFAPPSLRPWNGSGALLMRGPGVPVFTQHIEFYVTTAGRPFHAEPADELGGWMRLESAPATLTPPHLVCLIDAWPPSPVSHYDRPAPLSSINWGIHFAEPLDGVRGDDFLGYLARTNFFKDGYGSSAADVWAPDGRLLARSYQTFVIYG